MSSSLCSVICPFVAFLYPAYASYKAVNSPEPNDDTQWLTYWVITAIFHVAEVFGDRLVYWLPLYYEFKLICLIVLQNGTLKLPHLLYVTFLKPFLQPREPAIDEWLSRSYLNMLTSLTQGIQWLITNGPGFIAVAMSAINAATEAAKKNAEETNKRHIVRLETHRALMAKQAAESDRETHDAAKANAAAAHTKSE